MIVIFSKYLIGNDVAGFVPRPVPHGEKEYYVHCELGGCGMKHYVENNK